MSEAREHDRLEELLAQAGWLDRLARRLVRDPSEADDVVQETWVAALRGGPRTRSARAWLAQVARNVVLQRGRSESARVAREQAVARAEASDAEAGALERAQAQKQLVDAVLALEEPFRGALILHYFDRLSVAEVALRLGVPEATIRTRLSRGVAELRARFQRRDGAQWALAFLPLARPLIGGTLMTAAWKIAAGVTLVAALAWLAWPAREGLEAPGGTAQVGAPPAELDSSRELEQRVGAESRAELAAAPPAPATAAGSDRATLDLHVRWGDDGTDAGDIGLELWLGGAVDPFHDRRFGRTDAAGRAHFEDLAPGHVNVETDRSDGGCTLEPGEHATLELSIPDGIDVQGLVVDGDDRPVAGARIWVSNYFNRENGSVAATSDAGGAFFVRDVGPARYLGARHERYGPSVLEFLQKANPGQRVETKLVLGREFAEVSGLVHDESGRPIAGASVDLQVSTRFERDADGRYQGFDTAPELARTDEQGRFLLRGIAVSSVRISASAPGFAPSERTEQLVEGRNERDFALARMATLHGRVVDAQGAPVKAAFVGHGEYGDVASAQTWTRGDGSYRLVGLPPGSVEVRVDGEAKGKLRQTHTLRAGDDVEWDVKLVPKPGVFGRVLDAQGKPAAGFMVGAIQPEHPGLFERKAKTDAEGRFELGDWPAEASAIEVREQGAWVGLPAALVESVEPGSGEELVIQLAADALRSAWVVGRVLDENGKPIEAAELICFVESSGQGTSVATDAQGRFRYGPVRPGRYYVAAQQKGYAECTRRDLALVAEETKDVGDLQLERPGEIRVRLLLPAGFEAGQAAGYVALSDAGGRVSNSIEIREGAGALGGLAPGHYRLRFTGERLRAAPAEVDVQARQTSEVELVASPGTSRMVSVKVAEAARVLLRVRDAAGALVHEEESRVRPGQALFFSVPGLVLGSYTIEASTAEGAHAQGVLEVTRLEPESSLLELVL
jgi:RNA polymerase sigma-70 factor (ECF subfamily)